MILNRLARRAAKKFIAERDAAFLAGDVEWARRQLRGKPSCEEVVHAAFHKARLAVTYMPYHLRKQSADWLTEHGYSAFDRRYPHTALPEVDG